MICSFACKDHNWHISVSTWETGRSWNIRLDEYRSPWKYNSSLKTANHSIDTNHIPDFENCKIIKSKFNNFKSRILLESWFTRLHTSSLNETSEARICGPIVTYTPWRFNVLIWTCLNNSFVFFRLIFIPMRSLYNAWNVYCNLFYYWILMCIFLNVWF